jgi:hypothetical protein
MMTAQKNAKEEAAWSTAPGLYQFGGTDVAVAATPIDPQDQQQYSP